MERSVAREVTAVFVAIGLEKKMGEGERGGDISNRTVLTWRNVVVDECCTHISSAIENS